MTAATCPKPSSPANIHPRGSRGEGDEPYYPVNDEKNAALYARYKALDDREQGVIFGGRLGEYKYYDMDQVIAAALCKAQEV